MYKILVVDDEANSRVILNTTPRIWEHMVIEAVDGFGSHWNLPRWGFRRNRNGYHDASIDGFGAYKEIEKDIPVLMLSARERNTISSTAFVKSASTIMY